MLEAEQLAELGEPYWRRMHQLPGIDVCIVHRCKLEETSIPFHPKESYLIITPNAIIACHSRQTRCVDLTPSEKRVIEYHRGITGELCILVAFLKTLMNNNLLI